MNKLPCTGCRYLVHAWGQDVCSASDRGGVETRIDPYSGRMTQWVTRRPSLVEQRSIDGACKPERLLYEPKPTFWQNLKYVVKFVTHTSCITTGKPHDELYENPLQCHGVRSRTIRFCDVCGKTIESNVEYFT